MLLPLGSIPIGDKPGIKHEPIHLTQTSHSTGVTTSTCSKPLHPELIHFLAEADQARGGQNINWISEPAHDLLIKCIRAYLEGSEIHLCLQRLTEELTNAKILSCVPIRGSLEYQRVRRAFTRELDDITKKAQVRYSIFYTKMKETVNGNLQH